MLSGYFQDYDGAGAPAMALHDVSRRWDEICLAFAEVETDGRVQVRDRVVSGGRGSLEDAVRLRRALGQSVSISIGGAHATFAIHTGAAAANVTASVVELADRLGIDALDFNMDRLSAPLGTPVGELEISVWSINWDVQGGPTFSDALVRTRSSSVDESE